MGVIQARKAYLQYLLLTCTLKRRFIRVMIWQIAKFFIGQHLIALSIPLNRKLLQVTSESSVPQYKVELNVKTHSKCCSNDRYLAPL
jgi:hypothetical protein